ncbi:MAG: ABC transporter ATP-binding protein [bacterium]|nr:ABC transporter ATP-binding protein [bacterium]
METKETLRRLAREARRYAGRLAAALFFAVLAGLGPLSYAKALNPLFNDVLGASHGALSVAQRLRELWIIIAFLLAANVIAAAAQYCASYLTAWSGQRLIAEMRARLFERIVHFPLAEFDRWRQGELFARFEQDLQLMTDAVSISLPQLTQNTVTFVGAVIGMFVTDWRMALFLFIFVPIVYAAVARFSSLITTGTHRAQESIADLSSTLIEALGSVRTIKAFGREQHELARFTNRNEAYFGSYMKLTQLLLTQPGVVSILMLVAFLAIVVVSALEVVVFQRLNIGQVFQFWTLVVLASNPLNRGANFVGDLAKATVGAGRIFTVLDAPVENPAAPGAQRLLAPCGEVSFAEVSFIFPGTEEPALRQISFAARPGETVALVGPSGAGKTTLVNLIPRFYEPTGGRVMIDGVDARSLSLADLRSAIALVPQEPQLFGESVEENIRYGRLDATPAEIRRAAELANVTEFVDELPDGMATHVGERGVRLSGGQRQRIAIARAILRDPRILILDEATSALDSHSERLIAQALDHLLAGRTTFIIAHRLSTIRRATRILYLEAGRVIEEGSHQDLLARNGAYARLYAVQFSGT